MLKNTLPYFLNPNISDFWESGLCRKFRWTVMRVSFSKAFIFHLNFYPAVNETGLNLSVMIWGVGRSQTIALAFSYTDDKNLDFSICFNESQLKPFIYSVPQKKSKEALFLIWLGYLLETLLSSSSDSFIQYLSLVPLCICMLLKEVYGNSDSINLS